MKTVSVIVPAYNVAADLLQRCLRSLKEQTYPDLQIILADDGSDTPVPGAIRMPHRGLAATRNAALEYATGDFVMFLDSDDYLLPDCIQTAVREIGESDILQFGFYRVTTDGQPVARLIPYTFYRLTSACARLYRRSWLTDHPIRFEEQRYYEDVYFSVRMWLLHPRCKVIRYLGYCYTVNPASITSTIHQTDRQALTGWLRHQLHTAPTLRDKAIVAYTLLRIRLHFLKEQLKTPQK